MSDTNLINCEELNSPKIKRLKRSNKNSNVRNEKLLIKCEWKECRHEGNCRHKFYEHCSNHLELGNRHLEEEFEVPHLCEWGSCNFSSHDAQEFIRHVKYHGYLSGLKALGAYVIQDLNLPPCVISDDVSNSIPDGLCICKWDFCGQHLPGIQELIDHVHQHVICEVDQNFKCKWRYCESSFKRRSKLIDHMKTHTKDKFLACPNCGFSFSNKTKFVDHCQRQIPLEEHKYQCEHCRTFHATERMLKEHMRQHINHYRCPFCEMTCNKPSTVVRHLRYKHLGYKPFKCSSCDFRCKSKSDLQSHLNSHNETVLECSEPNCKYTCHSQTVLNSHYEMLHVYGKKGPIFACHLCDKKYCRGGVLTSHLFSSHNLKKPPGFSRFQYRLEDDGYYRLQTVRLESLDVSEIGEVLDNSDQSGAEEYIDDPHNKVMKEDMTPVTLEKSEKTVAIDVIGEKGQIISSYIVIADGSLPPPDAEIIAVGS